MENWEEKYRKTIEEHDRKEKEFQKKKDKDEHIRFVFNVIIVTIFFFSAIYTCVGQNDTIRGSIKHVDYTKPDGTYITIENFSNGELLEVRTNDYIRLQKEFFIENGENILPPPLHVTDIWVEDNRIYFTTSEPVQECTIWLREYRWDGIETAGFTPDHNYWQWASQTMVNSNGYITTHSYGIPRSFLGINWSWNLVIVIKNQKGELAESEMIRFKTDMRGYNEIVPQR